MARKPELRQNSFTGGEISPRLFGRTDLARYPQSAQQLRNFLVEQTGVATNRPGFMLVSRTKDTPLQALAANNDPTHSQKKVRLVPFVFNETQSYCLEFGEDYIRVHSLGGQVVDEVINAEGTMTAAGPSATTLTDSAQAWTVDEWKGGVIRNLTDGSEALIQSNTATTVVVTALLGGILNTWTLDDEYHLAYNSGKATNTAIQDENVLFDDFKADRVADQDKGSTAFNVTDGSTMLILFNGLENWNAGLVGGANNIWTLGDDYIIRAPVEVISPYKEEDLDSLDVAQQNDVMVITHQNYMTQQLRRETVRDSVPTLTRWVLVPVTVTRPVKPPTGLQLEASPAFDWDAPSPDHPDQRWDFVVTATDASGNESLPSDPLVEGNANLYQDRAFGEFEWTPATEGNPAVSYSLYRGRFGIYGFVAQTTTTQVIDEARVPDFGDGPPTARDPFVFQNTPDTFGPPEEARYPDPTALPSTQVAVKLPAEEAFDKLYRFNFAFRPTGKSNDGRFYPASHSIQFQWRNPPAAFATVLTKTFFMNPSVSELAGQWVSFSEEIFIDAVGKDAEFKIIPSQEGLDLTDWNNMNVTWFGTVLGRVEHTYPGSVCFFDQRLILGGFSKEPTTIKTSRSGDIFNFDVSEPLKDSDAIELTLASLRRDAIRDLVPLGAIIVLTSGAEWVVRGSEGAPLSPHNFDLKPKTVYGSTSKIRAIPLGDSVIFVTDGQKRLRELIVDPFGQQTTSRDLTVLAEHLFRRKQAIAMAYSDTPYQVVWVVRSDGTLLGLTYVREHDVFAWHTHDTGGIFEDGTPKAVIESACSIPENDESRLYIAVKRVVDGVVMRYIEAMASRQSTDLADQVFLDSSVVFDGRNKEVTNTTGEIRNLRLEPLEGAHDAGTSTTVMTDSSETWIVDEHVGQTIKNLRDGSSGVITANGTDTITVSALTGGTDNDWDLNDEYEIVPSWALGKKLILRAVGKARQGVHASGATSIFVINGAVDPHGPLDVNDEYNGGTFRNRTDLSTATILDTTYTGQGSATWALTGQTGGVDDDQTIGDVCDVEAPLGVAAVFKDADVGTVRVELRFTTPGTVVDASGRLTKTVVKVRCNVTRFVDATTIEVTPVTAVPTELQLAYTPEWGIARNAFVDSWHLRGEPIVGVLVDGATHADVAIDGSADFSLDSGIFGEVVVAGLHYVSELISLPLVVPEDAGKLAKKNIAAVGVEVDDFRGMFIGHKRSQMVEAQQRMVSQDYETISAENKVVILRPRASFGRLVNVIIQQRDPLPLTVQSIIATLTPGGSQ